MQNKELTPEQIREVATRMTQLQYNSGNMLNEMRVTVTPEEQLNNAHKLGMRFPDWALWAVMKEAK